MPTRTELYTLLALCVFILSFFPGIFHSLWTVPLSLLASPLAPSPSPPPPVAMSWAQTTFSLPARARGSYLITDEVVKAVPQIKEYKIGILHLFVQHTSCGIAMNENWDDDVRADMSDALDRIVPMDKTGKLYRHNAEGDDDMPVRAWALSVKRAGAFISS
jgi:secondary thiamine-phosphate synthase enzyme